MGRLAVGLAIALLIALAGAGALYYRSQRTEYHPGQGTPWTILQDTEEAHRADPEHAAPLLLAHAEGSSFYVLGLPTEDPAFPRAWILLNEHTPDGTFKRVPAAARFHVDCAYVDSLLATTPVDAPVQAFLKRQCGR